MLKFVTKEEFWKIEDQNPPLTPRHDLKHIQDVYSWNRLKDLSGVKIAEIGGGNSRLLPFLVEKNRIFNIDRFEGAGNGPVEQKIIADVIPCYIGHSKGFIEDEDFDVIFSISVIEHVPTEQLPNFFNDCWRILKPGGLMFHAIDCYLDDFGCNRAKQRVAAYADALKSFEPAGDVIDAANVAFRCEYATASDQAMRMWNVSAPHLRDYRPYAQSTTLVMEARKPFRY
jgi:SAM-dependent methyltransferase